METDSRLQRIEQELAELKSGQADLKATLTQVLQLLSRIDGRLDEQRATINALIPTRIAAVPPAAE
ncbi:hypothetical protein [Azospirillum sp. TSO22-1]|uniref:hypothetical protein n=1 Tax=Azospirillum sp. TSO22-1 TaxID=716789 RepID=UPI000D60C364|nr:hypothetical protein [Azospirillum sp. TSO22-1]PWC54721.1 hypothetical protein TSO221_07235 [Azospirillum sp. TSO22-1]